MHIITRNFVLIKFGNSWSNFGILLDLFSTYIYSLMYKSSKNLSSVIKSKSTQERVMQMLLFLMEQKTLVGRPTLERILNVNTRTIFRYFNIIEEEWNIPLIKDGGRYGVRRVTSSNNITFSSSELQGMYLSILDMPEGEIKQSLREKLLQMYGERKQAEKLMDHLILDRIEWFEHHVNKTKVKFQLRLKDYMSINGDTVRHRIVSPVYFNSINLELYAYDMETVSEELKVFKLERMSGQEKLKDRVPKSMDREHDFTRDSFGYLVKGQQLMHVTMQMDLLAFKLFELQFPSLMSKVEVYTHHNKIKYIVKLEMTRPDPIVGFCMSLLNHIEFENSDEFLEAMREFYTKHISVNLGKIGM
ncbi:MAG: hypothetical protein RJA76_1738 [Bacteroidota bacterium]